MVDLRTPGKLGPLAGELSVAKQLLGLQARGHLRHPDRALHPDLQLAQAERRRQHIRNPVGGAHGVANAVLQRHDHPELVAAGPGEPVARPQRRDQPAGKGDQQLVAGQATHAFVDAGEPQQVHHQHGMAAPSVALVRARRFDHLGKGQAVRETGQAVAQHLGPQVALRLHFHRPVGHRHQATRGAAAQRGELRQAQPVVTRFKPFPIPDIEFGRSLAAEPVVEVLGELARAKAGVAQAIESAHR